MRLGVPVRILAVAAVLALSLVGLVVREGAARAAGQEVKLAIGGFDPRSLLSGNYVEFAFSDQLAPGQHCPPLGLPIGEYGRRWVALRRVGDRHQPVGEADTREAALKLGDVAVKGTMQCFETTAAGATPPARLEPGQIWSPPQRAQVSLDVGLHRFHTNQEQALRIEEAMRTPGAAFVLLSVGDDGKARLKGMVVGGRRIGLDWF